MLKIFKNEKIDYQEYLYDSIELGDLNGIKRAIKCGADIEVPNELGNTALMSSILIEDCELIEYFLRIHAKVIFFDGYSMVDVLNFALTENPLIDAEVIKILLDAGCDPNFRDDDYNGVTPLMKAVAHNNLEVAKVLIENGSSVHYHDNNLDNVLVYASYKNIQDQYRGLRAKVLPDPECVKLILRHGGRIMKNLNNISPTDMSKKYKELANIYNILKKAKNYRKKA